MSEHDFSLGTVIFRPGDKGDRAYLIREGFVELLGGTAEHPTRLVKPGPGEVFGEMSLIEERPRRLTARAVTPVKASSLTREEFEAYLTSDPEVAHSYLKALFERMRTLATMAADAAEPAPTAKTLSVIIHPVTRKAAETLPDGGLLVPNFPFRIGRASEVREGEPMDLNDLWLLDTKPFNVSRNHALLDMAGDQVIIKDRGSSLGLYVNDVHIGGRSAEMQMALEAGDNVVVIGGRVSPYQFRIEVGRG